MAIRGYYQDDDTPPAPYVQAEIHLPAIRISGDIEFLVDTGADGTSLLPYDMARMGGSIQKIPGRYKEMDGIGGGAKAKTTMAMLRFRDVDALGGFREFRIDVDVIAPGKINERLPSLLGRDILNQCECTFNASSGNITLEPL